MLQRVEAAPLYRDHWLNADLIVVLIVGAIFQKKQIQINKPQNISEGFQKRLLSQQCAKDLSGTLCEGCGEDA